MLTPYLQNKIVKNILNITNPKNIILFGSFAEDRENENSDLDLLLIFDKINSKIKLKRKVRKALSEIDLPKDIVVATKEEFDFYKSEIGSVFKDANEKGKVLWSI